MPLFSPRSGKSGSSSSWSSRPRSPTFPYHLEANCSQCGHLAVMYNLRDSPCYLDRTEDVKDGLTKFWHFSNRIYDFFKPLKKVRTDTRELDHSLNVANHKLEYVLNELNDALMCRRGKNLIPHLTDIRELLKIHKSCIPDHLAALDTSEFDDEMATVEFNREQAARRWATTTEESSQPRS